MKRWVVAAKKADFDNIAKKYSISPMLARIIRNRDIVEDEEIRRFLYGTPEDFNNPHLLKDMDKAVSVLKGYVADKKHIRIIGDYDADGVCATYILLKALKLLDANVDYVLPDRVKDGYGMNLTMIEQAANDGVELIITCDNGIAAVKETEAAKEKGIAVIITDHHEPQEVLPKVDALVDPKQVDDDYPYKEICGAFVAYKFIQVFYDSVGRELPEELLEFAAFATVCDVMPLLNENRILVKYGLQAMAETKNLGLSTLIDITGIDRSRLSPYHVGFILGPCINATGRLDSADRGLRLFMTDDNREAALIAGELRGLNESRKEMTEFYTNKAINLVDKGDEYNPPMSDMSVLVVYLPDCHESIAGLVAGKLKERFYKPSIVLTRGEEGVKGSGRSIEAYSMFDSLSQCKDLFTKFGGHKMAAGMSLSEDKINPLREFLNENSLLTKEDLTEKITIDIPMPVKYSTEEFVEELDKLNPYGVGNPKPLFAQKSLIISSIRVMGKSRNVVKLNFVDEKTEGVYFTDGNVFEQEYHIGEKVSIIYCPEINEYCGRRNVQLSIKEIEKRD